MDLHNEIIIDQPAALVWNALGERFAHVSDWATAITDSSCAVGDDGPGVGAVRACRTAGLGPVKAGVVKERLLTFDRDRMSFEYEAADGMPSFVARAINRWSVHELDAGRSLVRIHATFTLQGPMALLSFALKWQMQSATARVAEELKYYVEHGAPHPRKLAAQSQR